MRRRVFPYWKVQYRRDVREPWMDVQRAHYDRGEAMVAAGRHTVRTGHETRLMVIQDRGVRHPD